MNQCNDLDRLRSALGGDIPDDDLVTKAIAVIEGGKHVSPRDVEVQLTTEELDRLMEIGKMEGGSAMAKLRAAWNQLKQFKIRVYTELSEATNDYQIIADSELDARVIAFCLDGGHTGNTVDRGIIELVKEWTTVL